MRALLPVATAVFALTSQVHGSLFKAKANATTDAQIHLYSFVSGDCTGEPYTSPYEMKQGKCVNFNQARSLRPRFRSNHADWLKEVNQLRMHCKLETFSDFGCSDNNKTEEYQSGLSGDLPENFNGCLVSKRQKNQPEGSGDGDDTDEEHYKNEFYSARFVCGKLEDPELLCTSIIEHTSWSIDSTYGAPHPSVHIATYTGSLSPSARASAAVDKRFKPGKETKGVWMLHPWSQSPLCYSCYTKKEHDYRKIECRGGDAYPAVCKSAPVWPEHTTHQTTTTSTTTAVTTTHRTRTTTAFTVSQHVDYLLTSSSSDSESDSDFPGLDVELQQKKSWHTPVKFAHPFLTGENACADAEWEKRGQGAKSYIKIQHVHICDKKDRDDSQWIGLPTTAVHTVRETETSTDTIMHTSTSTSTIHIKPVVRHDQL